MAAKLVQNFLLSEEIADFPPDFTTFQSLFPESSRNHPDVQCLYHLFSKAHTRNLKRVQETIDEHYGETSNEENSGSAEKEAIESAIGKIGNISILLKEELHEIENGMETVYHEVESLSKNFSDVELQMDNRFIQKLRKDI